MELTLDEKKVLKQLVDEHLEEVKKNEQLANTPPAFLAGEVKYEEFLTHLKKKLHE